MASKVRRASQAPRIGNAKEPSAADLFDREVQRQSLQLRDRVVADREASFRRVMEAEKDQ